MSQIERIKWSEFAPLPDPLGFAGMYAGVSSGAILAMGGANFPEKYPWEGGVKKWHDHIYILPPGGNWIKSEQRLPSPSGYGVSVSWNNKLILAGGCTATDHLADVFSYEWKNGQLLREVLPALPRPLAYMTGGLLGSKLVVLGGSESPTGSPTKTALVLDLNDTRKGWQAIEAWPGPERILPVSGVWNDQLFMMSGETSNLNPYGGKYRDILLDNYALTLTGKAGSWKATWKKFSPIPRGISAGGTLPLLTNNRFVVWGGVDAVTAQYRTPATHPGIIKSVLFYYPENDTWEYLGQQTDHASRVTLAVIPFENSWLYVSGEIKPGIRTPGVIRIGEP
jgi:N-acetylneuraminate epimerase